jgi:hypothetical protein
MPSRSRVRTCTAPPPPAPRSRECVQGAPHRGAPVKRAVAPRTEAESTDEGACTRAKGTLMKNFPPRFFLRLRRARVASPRARFAWRFASVFLRVQWRPCTRVMLGPSRYHPTTRPDPPRSRTRSVYSLLLRGRWAPARGALGEKNVKPGPEAVHEKREAFAPPLIWLALVSTAFSVIVRTSWTPA